MSEASSENTPTTPAPGSSPVVARWICAATLALHAVVPATAAVEGRLAAPDGTPIEGARLHLFSVPRGGEDAAPLAHTTSGRGGRFTFPEAKPPLELEIEHPRFLPSTVELVAQAPVLITLSPRQDFGEMVTVTAGREGESLRPESIASSSVSVSDRPAGGGTVVDLVQGLPGVAENGQGGRFQAYSIRGVAGQRVQSLVAGARVVTERRAGATVSFIDPLLISRIEVVRGPYSSYYGSSALGGVLQALPERFEAMVVDAGYEGQGHGRYFRLGLGSDSWSLGIARRAAGDAETPDGETLFSRYEQWSASLLKTFELPSGLQGEFLILPAIGRDIGKPNARFPARTTLYPEENHLITRFTLRRSDVWRLDLWAHPNELSTLNTRSDQREEVRNEAFDFGLTVQREFDLPDQWAGQAGIDLFGRRGVIGSERLTRLDSGEITETTTLDGEETETALYASVRRGFGRVNVEAGARYTRIAQANRAAPSTQDGAFSGFAGITVPVGGGFELASNLGTGLRFPGLSERFFTGATGRGEVFANPDLKPERSLAADLGLRWYGQRAFLATYVFRNEIDDYIERVELDTGISSFANLTSGVIEGFEIEGFLRLSDALKLSWSGQSSRGRSKSGEPLADIAPNRVEGDVSWEHGHWSAAGRWQHRFSKSDAGPGEQRVAAAEAVSASFAYRLREGLRLTVSAMNLLDEAYLPSADDLSVPAQGRSLGVGVSWER